MRRRQMRALGCEKLSVRCCALQKAAARIEVEGLQLELEAYKVARGGMALATFRGPPCTDCARH
jgi:hypothetical protein